MSHTQINLDTSLKTPNSRIASLDAYRGYAFFGMLLVNYLGQFDSMPWQFKHHDSGMSFADTIAPLFAFIAGIGFRFSFLRATAATGVAAARITAVKRYVVLILVGITLYGPAPDNWVYWWDALVDIGFAGLLALPFLTQRITVRAAAAFAYLAVFQIAYVFFGYEEWTLSESIDGGPLGVLSWGAILIFGTIALDLISKKNTTQIVRGCLAWGLALCLAGWLLKIEWVGVKAEWPFTQRGMSAPYPLFASGLCFLMCLPFHFVCDVLAWRIPHLAVLGMNPLVLYIVQQVLLEMHGTFLVPPNAGPFPSIAGFLIFYLACYAVAWKLSRDRLIIKL